MKRNFEEEYKNYIESDVPDLWARIEPNLKEKSRMAIQEEIVPQAEGAAAPQKEKAASPKEKAAPKKLLLFIRYAAPAAACLCVLLVGVRVFRLNGGEKNADAGRYEEAADETAYQEAESADADEESCGEEGADTGGGACYDYVAAESEDADGASYEAAKSADTDGASPAAAGKDTEEEKNSRAEQQSADGVYENTVNEDFRTEGAQQPVEIAEAVLSKIAQASAKEQDAGYAYVYTFVTEDGGRVLVYATAEQCRSMEEQGVLLQRKETYRLTIVPCRMEESSGTADEEGILQKIEKLP